MMGVRATAAKNYRLNKLLSSNYNSRTFFVLSVAVLAALTIDLYISSAADTLRQQASSSWGMVLFATICIVSIWGQYFFLTITKTKVKKGDIRDSQIILLYKMLIVVTILLATLVIFSVLAMYIKSQYPTPIISAIVIGGYGFASIIMGVLTYKLLNWFKSKKSLVVLVYGLAAGAFTVNAIASTVLFEMALAEKPLIFTSNSPVEFNWKCSPNSFKCSIITFQTYTLYSYFILMWIGSVILLRHNIKRVGRIQFWVLSALPIIAFYVAYVSAYNEIYQIGSVISKGTPLVMMTLIIAFGTSCGILYGIGFRSIGKLVSSSQVKDYMIVAAYGIVFYFIAANSTVGAAGYPPFGIASVSFVPLAAFMILLGLYSSAISVANDTNLRREVKSSVMRETNLLGSIGTAQMQQEIEKKVMKITIEKADMITKDSGIAPSLSESEIRQHLDDVMNEITKKREYKESISSG